jgi:hypothetical protein
MVPFSGKVLFAVLRECKLELAYSDEITRIRW